MNYSLKTIIYVVVILAVSGVLVALLLASAPKPIAQSRQLHIPIVDVININYQNLLPTIRLTGRLQPTHKSKLRFEVSGRIAKRLIEPGQKTKISQVLLTLEGGDYQDAVAEASAQHTLENASIQRDNNLLVLAKRNTALQVREVKRLNRLGKGALVSQSRLGESRQRLYQLRSEEARLSYKVHTASARILLKKTALERAKRNLKRTELKAPFDGVVNSVMVQKGDFVSPDKMVVELVSRDQVELYLQVRNQVATALFLGAKVKVFIGDKQVQGSIIALQADPDSSTFTHALRIKLPDNAGSPGLLASVSLQLKPLTQVIAVPLSTIFHKQGAAYVYVADKDMRVKRRKVKLGSRVGRLMVVEHGLLSGDQVIRGDLSGLKVDQKIKLKSKTESVNVSKHL